MPAVVFPQLLLGRLFVTRENMAPVLEALSNALALTYAYDALVRVTAGEDFSGHVGRDIAVILGSIVLSLVLGAATLRRRTP